MDHLPVTVDVPALVLVATLIGWCGPSPASLSGSAWRPRLGSSPAIPSRYAFDLDVCNSYTVTIARGDHSPLSAVTFSLVSEVAQRLRMSRDASGAASLPRPLKTTSSSTRTEVPNADGVSV